MGAKVCGPISSLWMNLVACMPELPPDPGPGPRDTPPGSAPLGPGLGRSPVGPLVQASQMMSGKAIVSKYSAGAMDFNSIAVVTHHG